MVSIYKTPRHNERVHTGRKQSSHGRLTRILVFCSIWCSTICHQRVQNVSRCFTVVSSLILPCPLSCTLFRCVCYLVEVVLFTNATAFCSFVRAYMIYVVTKIPARQWQRLLGISRMSTLMLFIRRQFNVEHWSIKAWQPPFPSTLLYNSAWSRKMKGDAILGRKE